MKDRNQPILSVIIPCYNCAPVIVRCLNSIDCSDAEIIVVNDGSTDNSADVIAEYIRRVNSEERIVKSVRLVNKPNGGVSSARNFGIEEAHGKYISFIDADDYIVRGGLERIVNIAEEYEADVVKFKNINVSGTAPQDMSSVADVPIQVEQTTGIGVLQRYDISDYVVWDGIYRRSVIADNHIRFMTDLCLREDDTFMGMLYCHVNTVVVTDLQLYRYVSCSSFSSVHNQNVEKQRKLIMSGLLATQHRSHYVKQHCPQAMKLERLKYMRWVCTPRQALQAEMSYAEYRTLLKEFEKEEVYPLDYAWIKTAGWDYAWQPYIKRVIVTFFINHPAIGWRVMSIWYKRSKNK